MVKAVLIMDTPEWCSDCYAVHKSVSGTFCRAAKKKLCGKYPQPGKPVPSYRCGWNACLREIIGEKK